MNIFKIAIIKSAEKPLQAFQMSKDVINELHYTNCKGIKDAIDTSEPGIYKLDNAEAGHFGQTCHDGDIIRYEEYRDANNCPAGWNLWVYGLPVAVKTATEIYSVVDPRDAVFVENINDVVNFIKDNSSSDWFNERVTATNNTIAIKTDWGVSNGKVGNCFVVKYGKDDFNILTLGTPTVDECFILDADGNITKCLNQY